MYKEYCFPAHRMLGQKVRVQCFCLSCGSTPIDRYTRDEIVMVLLGLQFGKCGACGGERVKMQVIGEVAE